MLKELFLMKKLEIYHVDDIDLSLHFIDRLKEQLLFYLLWTICV